ncbi:MAG: transglycosylase domain-containing protein, partial [Patescibacteria group bacterium]
MKNKEKGEIKKKLSFSQKIKNSFKNNRSKKKIIFLSIVLAGFLWLFWGIPLPTRLSSEKFPVSTKLFDRNGKLIYEIYTEKKRTPIELEEVPEYVRQATISIEDKDFYKHYGFSPVGITRAAINILFKQKLQGGSTITQQLVKNALLTPRRTIRRKIREFLLSMVVEGIYSKDQILEMYFNQIPYGSTAYGIEAAANLYFGKSAKDLTLAEGALLAGITQAPTRYSPFGAHPELAKGRQETVLRRMVEDGYITQEEADKAKEEEIVYAEPQQQEATHFALWVKEQLAEEYGDAVVEQGGLRVTTTLDLELQEFNIEDIIDRDVSYSKELTYQVLSDIQLNEEEIELYFLTTGRDAVSLGEISLLIGKEKEECKEIADKFVEKGLYKEIVGATPHYAPLPPYAALMKQLSNFNEYIKGIQEQAPAQLNESFSQLEATSKGVSELNAYTDFIRTLKERIDQQMELQKVEVDKAIKVIGQIRKINEVISNLE